MGLKHYFFGNEDERAQFVFNLIAPVYSLIDKGSEKEFRKMAALLNDRFPLSGKSILDVGCGTGSWINALAKFNPQKMVGTDFSLKMLQQARQKHPEIEFVHQSGENLSAFQDNSFDIVTASFVLHGMKTPKRTRVLAEMKRIARDKVVIHDFYTNHHWIVRLLEFLERSDYIHFKQHFTEELKGQFIKTTLITADNGNALYVGIK
jgi:ubiquinone/menaquinone biosynthesis C-methylase UbiE